MLVGHDFELASETTFRKMGAGKEGPDAMSREDTMGRPQRGSRGAGMSQEGKYL